MRISQQRVAVTGGAGFIGSHVVDLLLQRDNDVVVIDDFSTGSTRNLIQHENDPRLSIVRADIRDEVAMSNLFEASDFVFHLATRDVRSSLAQPTVVHEVATTGTLNVLKAAVAAGVKRLLYCSSSEVNGTADVVPMVEDYKYRPETIYGAGKLAGEYYAQVFFRAGWLPTVVARPHNNYGPREHYEGVRGEVIPRFILRALAGRPLTIFGAGRQTRDFTYVTETAEILIDLLECDSAIGLTFNVCRGEEVSIRDLANQIKELTQSSSSIEFGAHRPSDVLRLCGDASRLQATLGKRPSLSIRAGLTRTIEWFKQNVAITDQVLSRMDDQNWVIQTAEPWLQGLIDARQAGWQDRAA